MDENIQQFFDKITPCQYELSKLRRACLISCSRDLRVLSLIASYTSILIPPRSHLVLFSSIWESSLMEGPSSHNLVLATGQLLKCPVTTFYLTRATSPKDSFCARPSIALTVKSCEVCYPTKCFHKSSIWHFSHLGYYCITLYWVLGNWRLARTSIGLEYTPDRWMYSKYIHKASTEILTVSIHKIAIKIVGVSIRSHIPTFRPSSCRSRQKNLSHVWTVMFSIGPICRCKNPAIEHGRFPCFGVKYSLLVLRFSSSAV